MVPFLFNDTRDTYFTLIVPAYQVREDKVATLILALTFHMVMALSELFQVFPTQSFKAEQIVLSYVLREHDDLMTCITLGTL